MAKKTTSFEAIMTNDSTTWQRTQQAWSEITLKTAYGALNRTSKDGELECSLMIARMAYYNLVDSRYYTVISQETTPLKHTPEFTEIASLDIHTVLKLMQLLASTLPKQEG